MTRNKSQYAYVCFWRRIINITQSWRCFDLTMRGTCSSSGCRCWRRRPRLAARRHDGYHCLRPHHPSVSIQRRTLQRGHRSWEERERERERGERERNDYWRNLILMDTLGENSRFTRRTVAFLCYAVIPPGPFSAVVVNFRSLPDTEPGSDGTVTHGAWLIKLRND